MIGCGKKTPSDANASGNGVVRKVYTGNGQGQDNVSISIPELTLSDPPSLVVYAQSDSTGEYSPDYPDYSEISEGKITFRNPVYSYKIVVIK
jgi:hypothetical protein